LDRSDLRDYQIKVVFCVHAGRHPSSEEFASILHRKNSHAESQARDWTHYASDYTDKYIGGGSSKILHFTLDDTAQQWKELFENPANTNEQRKAAYEQLSKPENSRAETSQLVYIPQTAKTYWDEPGQIKATKSKNLALEALLQLRQITTYSWEELRRDHWNVDLNWMDVALDHYISSEADQNQQNLIGTRGSSQREEFKAKFIAHVAHPMMKEFQGGQAWKILGEELGEEQLQYQKDIKKIWEDIQQKVASTLQNQIGVFHNVQIPDCDGCQDLDENIHQFIIWKFNK
jgi:hypothetical protein